MRTCVCVWSRRVCGMCESVQQKGSFCCTSAGDWLPRGVSLISRITGFCGSYREQSERLRRFPLPLLLCSLKTTAPAPLPLLLCTSVTRLCVSPRRHAGFPWFNKLPGDSHESTPRNLLKGSKQGAIHPQMAPFPSQTF